MTSQALSRGDEITYLELDEEPQNNSFDRAWDLWNRELSTEGR